MTDHEPVCDMGCDKECTLAYCSVCGEDWPCETVQLRATVARVKGVLAEYLDPEDADIECREDVWRFIRDLRSALEGEKS